MPSVLILGATSTIAKAVAAEFARLGYDLILAGRSRDELEATAADLSLRYRVDATALRFDALDFDGHPAILGECLRKAGDSLAGVALFVGYLGDQGRAQSDLAEARRIIDTNFTGCVSALAVVANHFEGRGRGFICAVSSVAGDRGRQSNYLYGAAKAGLTAYLEGLRNRLFRSRVRVITIKPGPVDTRMTMGLPRQPLMATPEAVARDIVRAIRHGKDTAYVPWFWRPIMFLIRNIPEPLFKRLRL